MMSPVCVVGCACQYSEAELLSGTSAALSQIERVTVEVSQVRDTILTQSKELENIGQLKTFLKSLEYDTAL